ncbi:hypothetical protein ACRE_064040 [Hapsidospora chrysogenum ATCC 11550]|uniref:Uncharacterized protein n=1 Tax=Hapsidospora chrysogenum (strain ATCC 11550 / CBS 779.69 / DSM 880 / IAM 14645 / JCM 23072 / IMI 49137) TaxID=857340 RepID=A0A086T0H4_HAPC1|nr:hypothetical protein ACRE_064040 [Hapsidospora chrysogenum ATCC 11550]
MKVFSIILMAAVAAVSANDICRLAGEGCNVNRPEPSLQCCPGSTCVTPEDAPAGSFGIVST